MARGIVEGTVRKILLLLVTVLLSALPFGDANAVQCVSFARQASGVHLQGDAWQWWNAAEGVYARGDAPRQGAVLVFSRQGSMHHGHVSVVSRVVSSRIVLVDHANWAPARGEGRGQVAQAVPVLDVSPANDWSQVRVWYRPAGLYGNRVYGTEGFVYSNKTVADAGPQPIEEAAIRQMRLAPIRQAAFKMPAPRHASRADRAQSRPTSTGLVMVSGHLLHPRPRPAELTVGNRSATPRPSGG